MGLRLQWGQVPCLFTMVIWYSTLGTSWCCGHNVPKHSEFVLAPNGIKDHQNESIKFSDPTFLLPFKIYCIFGWLVFVVVFCDVLCVSGGGVFFFFVVVVVVVVGISYSRILPTKPTVTSDQPCDGPYKNHTCACDYTTKLVIEGK